MIGDKAAIASLDTFAEFVEFLRFGFHLLYDAAFRRLDKLDEQIDFLAAVNPFTNFRDGLARIELCGEQ